MSNDVERVRRRVKALLQCEIVDHGRHGRLEGRTRGHVDDFAAERTEQMVVVMREVLSQLKASELIVGGDSSYDPGALEIREVAVGGASRHVGNGARDVRDAERTAGRGEKFDDRLTTTRVALIDAAQVYLH